MGGLAWAITLAAVFAAAAGGKLADLPGSRASVAGFGVPDRLARIVGTALPIAELAVALALVATPRAGAVAAVALLLGFVAAVTRAMVRGEQVECHCFGAIHSAPVGWKTLGRNAVLALIAAAIAIRGGESAAAVVPLVLAVGAAAYRWARRPKTRRAPGFEVRDTRDDGFATLASLLAPGKPLLLLFTDSNCGPCHALLPEAARWQDEFADDLSIAVISSGSAEDTRVTAAEHGLRAVFMQDGRSVSSAFGVSATPSGVLVEPGGTITRAVAPGADAIRTLLPGTPDPRPRELTTLDGEVIELERGRRRTVLLFWNPDCGFCRQIEDEIVEWEGSRRRSDPRLVVVARGDVTKLPFAAPIVPDPDGSLMRAFGAPGTPSAVRVERDGSVVADLAAGGPDTLALVTADGVKRRELIGSAGTLIALASMVSPAAAFGAKRKRCPSGRRLCASRCCPKGATCRSKRVKGKLLKKCVCPTGRHVCGTRCVSLTSDPKNCGACGHVCAAGQTCQAGRCVGGTQEQPQQTAPTCTDGTKNGTETDIDCGGPTCPKCADGKGCTTGSDCESGVCTGGVCSQPAATCSDGLRNGGETDVDCGGPQCPACANGKACVAGTDCTSGHCVGGVCRECSANTDCPQGPLGDCHAAVCNAGVCGFAVDDNDTPASNGNDCQTPVCASGTPAYQSSPAGTQCSSSGGHVCDGAGTCVQCTQPSDCPAGNQCTTPSCTNNTCAATFVANGTPCSEKGGTVCDGAGHCIHPCSSDSDCIGSGTACGGTCQFGTCSYPIVGTPCGAGHFCDGGGLCI